MVRRLRAGDLVDVGGDVDPRPEVGADEHDAGVGRGRQEAQADVGPRQEADAAHLGRPGEGPLVAVTLPSHGIRLPRSEGIRRSLPPPVGEGERTAAQDERDQLPIGAVAPAGAAAAGRYEALSMVSMSGLISMPLE